MIATDAVKYLPQMGLDPSRVVGRGTVSEVFHTREWICRRSSRCRKAFDRLLLFG